MSVGTLIIHIADQILVVVSTRAIDITIDSYCQAQSQLKLSRTELALILISPTHPPANHQPPNLQARGISQEGVQDIEAVVHVLDRKEMQVSIKLTYKGCHGSIQTLLSNSCSPVKSKGQVQYSRCAPNCDNVTWPRTTLQIIHVFFYFHAHACLGNIK